MLNTHACTYVGIRSKQKQGRSASPPKQIGNTYFHMQGAGLNVILKVYVGRYVCMYACMYVYAGFGLGFMDTTCRYNYVIICSLFWDQSCV